jgi:cell wall-associated NlpC family hydrolase
LGNFPRGDSWWTRGGNLIADNFKAAGFIEVQHTDIQVGDVLTFSIGRGPLNHLAVYIGGGLMLHHLTGRLSRKEPVLPWKNHHVGKVYRYGT